MPLATCKVRNDPNLLLQLILIFDFYSLALDVRLGYSISLFLQHILILLSISCTTKVYNSVLFTMGENYYWVESCLTYRWFGSQLRFLMWPLGIINCPPLLQALTHSPTQHSVSHMLIYFWWPAIILALPATYSISIFEPPHLFSLTFSVSHTEITVHK